MFKNSTISYMGSRKVNDGKDDRDVKIYYRFADITIKAENEEEATFLMTNLKNYIKSNSNISCEETDMASCENNDNYVEYYDTIIVFDKDEYDELKDLYKEWKKIAKTLVMPTEKTVKTSEVEIQESTITEAPVCNNETTENNTEVATTTETIELNTQETTNHVNNSNVTITEPVASLPTYVIHTKPIDNPFAIGRVIRVDLYNNAAITDIQELSNYVLEQYQEGHVDSNGQRQVTYWKIINIKNSIPTITESNNTVEQKQDIAIIEDSKWVSVNNFDSIELDDIILYEIEPCKFIKTKVTDISLDKQTIYIETEEDIYKLTITDIDKIRIEV